MSAPLLNPLATYSLDEQIANAKVVRNPEGQIITFDHNPIDEAVQAVREAQDSAGKGIWEDA